MTALLILSYLSKIGLLKVICYQGVKGYGNHIPFDLAHYMRQKLGLPYRALSQGG